MSRESVIKGVRESDLPVVRNFRHLSGRQREVLSALNGAYGSAPIGHSRLARDLGISRSSVRVHELRHPYQTTPRR